MATWTHWKPSKRKQICLEKWRGSMGVCSKRNGPLLSGYRRRCAYARLFKIVFLQWLCRQTCAVKFLVTYLNCDRSYLQILTIMSICQSGSGRAVQAFHHKHVQTDIKCLHIPLHKQHFVTEEYWSEVCFSAIRYSVTAHCFIHTDVLTLYFVVFTSKIQSPLVAEI